MAVGTGQMMESSGGTGEERDTFPRVHLRGNLVISVSLVCPQVYRARWGGSPSAASLFQHVVVFLSSKVLSFIAVKSDGSFTIFQATSAKSSSQMDFDHV